MDQEDDAGDIGLAKINDHSIFVHVPPSKPRRPIPYLRRVSSSFTTSPTSPEDPNKRHLTPTRSPSALARSQTLPRVRPRSPLHEPSSLKFDAPPLDDQITAALRRWIHCIVLVNFDLDIGPVIYGIYPTFDLSPSERENISFSSFPDSSHFEEYSQVHSFRIRESNPKRMNNTSEYFLHGFAYFSRKRNSAAKRGYEQQSVVLISKHPWPSIFTELVSCLGPMYLSHGAPMLEAACHNIASWSEPTPGSTLELGFLGTVLNVELPDAANDQQLTETSSFQKNGQDQHILASTAPSSPPPLRLFAASLSHMWSIWECLILNEPLVIYGKSPAMTSQAVWWLLDVLRPLPFGGDFRPYFTIHDNDYLSLVNKNHPQSGLLLGVTNPFITSTCNHWPHVLSLGREAPKRIRDSRGSSSPPIAGPPPGWQTKTHKRHISKDRELLKQLESKIDGGEAAECEASQLLRRHFSSRTSAFLVPLNRYLTTLIPTPSEIPVHTGATSAEPKICLKPFNQTQFFASLKTHGSPLPFKSTAKRKDFYERWLRSPSFGLWIAKQDEIVSEVLSKNAQRAANTSSEK